MTVIETGRRGGVEVLADIAKSDPGTAELAMQMICYDALCEEVDRLQPWLDSEVSKLVSKRAEGALEQIAKRYPAASPADQAELEDMAEALYSLVQKDNRSDHWWVARQRRVPAGSTGPNGEAPGEWVADPTARQAQDARAKTMRGIASGLNLFRPQNDAVGTYMNERFQTLKDSDRAGYARAIGRGLKTLPGMSVPGQILQLAGDIGPEAQRVFGHGLKRLAYRYRGTERRPDAAMARAAKQIAQRTSGKAKDEHGRPIPREDEKRLNAIGNLGTRALYDAVPDFKTAELSLKAGRLPPSVGIIFDAQGNAVTESVGFNGDNYLPFDLKNLKRLQGGQYVRTRATGGLTDEDIYTGLLTGARQIQVVSNSGVFTIEFDPSLRGGRRYSDKARQMTKRYAALLETIKNAKANDLLAVDLSPQDMVAARERALARAKKNPALFQEFFDDEVERERLTRSFQEKDQDELMAEAEAQAKDEFKNKPGSAPQLQTRVRDLFHEKLREQRDNQVRHYRLDGEGYRAAQKALQREFPYFIRKTGYVPLSEWLPPDQRRARKPAPGRDLGYVARGELKPAGAGRGRQAPGDDAAEEDQEQAPRGQGAGEGATPRAEQTEDAPWIEALHDSETHRRLGHLFGQSLAARSQFGADAMLPVSDSRASAEAAAGQGSEAWTQWLNEHGPDWAARYLLDPQIPVDHIDLTIQGIRQIDEHLKIGERAGAGPSSYNKGPEAIRYLQQVRMLRQPYNAEDSIFAEPDTEHPAPPSLGWDEYVENPDEIIDYVEDPDNEAVVRLAQTILDKGKDDYDEGDRYAADQVNQLLEKVRAIRRWNEKPTRALPRGIDEDDARGFLADPENHELGEQLRERQEAWALARTSVLSEVITDSEVQGLSPKVQKRDGGAPLSPARSRPGTQTSRPRTTSTGVSKSRRAPSARSAPFVPIVKSRRPLSPSPLASELAKRLANDPELLLRLLAK